MRAQLAEMTRRSTRQLLRIVFGLVLVSAAESARAQPVPSVSDTLIDFGSVPFPNTSVKPFWVRNSGDASLIVSAVISSDPSHFTASPTVLFIAPGDSGQVDVSFTPLTVAPWSATLTVVSFNAQPDSIEVQVTGVGAPNVPTISVSADTIAMDVQDFTTRDTTVTVTNTGGGTLSWSIPGGPNFLGKWYDFVPWTDTQASSASKDVLVTFDGSAGLIVGQTFYETVTFDSNDSGNPSVPLVLALTLVPGPPQPSINVTGSFSFQSFVGIPDVHTINVLNNGTTDTLHVTDIFLIDNEFTASETAFNVPPSGVHQITITHLATQEGTKFGQTVFVSDDPVAPFFNEQTIATVASPPIVVIPPDSITATLLSAQSTTRTVSIGNAGTGSSLNWTLSIIGLPSGVLTADFAAGVVQPGNTEIRTLTFDATQLLAGDYLFTLRFNSNDPVTPVVEVPTMLHVNAAPAIAVGPTSLIFDTIIVTQSQMKQITITSMGSDTLLVTGASVSGSAFVVGALPGPIPRALGAVLDITFDPPSAGTWLDTLVITSNATVDPIVRVPLGGVAVPAAPAIQTSVTSIDFGSMYVGVVTAAQLTVSNPGTALLNISSITTDNPAFGVGTWLPTLAPGASFNMVLSFAPSVPGVNNGTLSIASDAAGTPVAAVSLTGTGIAGDVSFTPANPGVTLVSDGRGQAWVDITNAGAADFPYQVTLFDASIPAPAPPATGGESSPIATPPPVATPAYFENFEDGDIGGWIETPGTTAVRAVALGGANGSVRRFQESGSESGHQSGIYNLLPGVQASEVGFWVRPGQDDLFSNYVTIRDGANAEVIFFFAMGTAVFYCNASTGGDATVPYVVNQWYHIEYRNINWTAKTFDYYVDDALITTGVGMRNPSTVDEFSRVDLYSFSAGAMASWDEIWLSWGVPAAWVAASPTAGSVGASESRQIALDFDATGLPEGTYEALMTLRSGNAVAPLVSIPVTLTVDNTTTGIEDLPGLPDAYALLPNQPNPFNPVTTIRYDLPSASTVSLVIYDVRGARVRKLVDRAVVPGRHSLVWDGTDDNGRHVASGVYFYRLHAGSFVQTRKMVLLK